MTTPSFLHPLPSGKWLRPKQFTYPFHYSPHPLCVAAEQEVRAYLAEQPQQQAAAAEGKMFGVLVVDTPQGLGFLAAFSGILAGSNKWPWFVPPIYDLQHPSSYFVEEEACISRINHQIDALEHDEAYCRNKALFTAHQQQALQEIEQFKLFLKAEKEKRDRQRQEGADEAVLIRESQQQKADLSRLKYRLKLTAQQLSAQITNHEATISSLKAQRHARSQALQDWLFQQYVLLDANGQRAQLPTLFDGTPPAASGECCAPKLLQCAYANGWQPVAMAEFWVGKSPTDELRVDGHYYPACRSKCRPILRHMLRGLDVEPNPVLQRNREMVSELELVYSDRDIAVINKPSGMLSVPGNEDVPSVKEVIQQRFPNATGPLIVHRLDMDTSGLMVLALNMTAYRHLQRQFSERQAHKRYVARVAGHIEGEGTITLPLCPNPDDRPRQMVNKCYGKEAITRYQTVAYDASAHTSLLYLWPETGRTHQLRVHCAHPEGLNAPIIGDPLYGTPSTRLLLHAAELCITHPITHQPLRFVADATFPKLT